MVNNIMKKKVWEVWLLDAKKNTNLIHNAHFETADTNANLIVKLMDKGLSATAGIIALSNHNDESFVEEVVEVENNTMVYKIPTDVIAHAGFWSFQVTFEHEGEDYVTSRLDFTVKEHLSHSKFPRLESVERLEELSERLQDLIDASDGSGLTVAQIKGVKVDNAVNADTVNNKTVKSNVPANANFENTTYSAGENIVVDEDNKIHSLGGADGKTLSNNVVKKTPPVVSFYLDDGYANDYEVVLPKVAPLDIPVTVGLINNSALGNTPDRLHELVNDYGWEVSGHTATHPDLRELTKEELHEEMILNKQKYSDLGFDLKGLCYPMGFADKKVLEVVREHFTHGLSSQGGINNSPIDTYWIRRHIADGSSNLETLKSVVDKIIEDGTGWVIFYSHSNGIEDNPLDPDVFFEMVDYVHEKQVQTLTVSDALELYGNRVDIGDRKYDERYFKVGSKGNVDSSAIPIKRDFNNENFFERPFNTFESGKITINTFYESQDTSGFNAEAGRGTVYTDRMSNNRDLTGINAIQTFVADSGEVRQRTWSGSLNEWTEEVSLGGYNTVGLSGLSFDTPITDFPSPKVHIQAFVSGDLSNMPGSSIGTLKTVRLGRNDLLSYQIWYPYNSSAFYKRQWTSSGWSVFNRINGSDRFNTGTLDFGTVAPGGTSAITVERPNVNMGDPVSASANYGIVNGIIVNAAVNGANSIQIKVFNITDSPIDVSRSFNVMVIK